MSAEIKSGPNGSWLINDVSCATYAEAMERLRAIDPDAHGLELKKAASMSSPYSSPQVLIGLILIVFVIGFMVWSGFKVVEFFRAPVSAETEAKLTEIKLHRLARERVSATLKDPGSAQYRNQAGSCGEVNAKNGFGAYMGYTRFIAASSEVVLLDNGSTADRVNFDYLWSSVCK